MKKTRLLHPELVTVIAQMGHGDTLCIADCGLPIPEEVWRIDLALEAGVPSFPQTLKAILSELHIEMAMIAEETKQVSKQILSHWSIDNKGTTTQSPEMLLSDWVIATLRPVPVTFISHEVFKQHTHSARAIIRTGEQTPYANIILKSGVVF